MKTLYFFALLYLPLTIVAQFPYDVIPLTGFNDLILFRDVDENQKWHMKIQNNGALGFTETGVADLRMTLNPGGGFGINAIPALDELLVVKTNANDGVAKIVLDKDGNLAISDNATIFGDLNVSKQATFSDLVEVFDDEIIYGNLLIGGFLSMAGNIDLSSGFVNGDLGINVHPSDQVTFSVKAQPDDTWVIYADDTASDVKFSVQTNGNAFLKGTLTQNSDLRLKKSITQLSETRDALSRLNGYSYLWKDESADQNKQLGLIAQEVREVYPELVHRSDSGMLSVNYIGFVPILIQAINEQSEVISTQSRLIAELSQRLDRLEKTLDMNSN